MSDKLDKLYEVFIKKQSHQINEIIIEKELDEKVEDVNLLKFDVVATPYINPQIRKSNNFLFDSRIAIPVINKLYNKYPKVFDVDYKDYTQEEYNIVTNNRILYNALLAKRNKVLNDYKEDKSFSDIINIVIVIVLFILFIGLVYILTRYVSKKLDVTKNIKNMLVKN